jgi:hypothetical protein
VTKKFAIQLLVVLALTLAAAAQSESLRALYGTAATIKTNVEGIRAYPAPPSGFDPITASDQELAAYGIPLRPDKVQDPDNYSQWARVARLAANPRSRWNGELKPRKAHGSLAVLVPAQSTVSDGESAATDADSVNSRNWSGAVNTLPLTKWSNTQSFSYVIAWFNVPFPQEAFAPGGGNICDGDTDQASFWVGLGGFWPPAGKRSEGNQNNVAQSGVDITTTCGFEAGAYAWVEWNPGPGVYLFGVNAGDDILVSVQANSPTSATAFIADFTLQQDASYAFDAPSGFQMAGSEAEFIVERPAGDTNNPYYTFYPLANYVWSFWDFAHATTFSNVNYYPGSNSSSTYRVTMLDDGGDQAISVPDFDKGGQNLFVHDKNCAYYGGCTE